MIEIGSHWKGTSRQGQEVIFSGLFALIRYRFFCMLSLSSFKILYILTRYTLLCAFGESFRAWLPNGIVGQYFLHLIPFTAYFDSFIDSIHWFVVYNDWQILNITEYISSMHQSYTWWHKFYTSGIFADLYIQSLTWGVTLQHNSAVAIFEFKMALIFKWISSFPLMVSPSHDDDTPAQQIDFSLFSPLLNRTITTHSPVCCKKLENDVKW